jgi:hypothetical protein
MAGQKIMGHPAGETVKLDAGDEDHLAYEVHNADLVISMHPARMLPAWPDNVCVTAGT